MERTGTATFFQRFELTSRLEEMVKPVFEELGIQACEYGQNTIIGRNGSLEALMKKLKSKKSAASLLVKFAPDFLCLAGASNVLFFMDIKTSLTPVLFDSKLDEIRRESGVRELTRERVGLVEREAWDNYRNRYPAEKTAILMACPYHPRLLVMEWVSNIHALFRFEEDTNVRAAGSQTPHVNIDLGSMRTLQDFLSEELEMNFDKGVYEEMLNFVKTWPLSNPGRPWKQFNNCVVKLMPTCPWLRCRNATGFIDPPHDNQKLDL